MKHGAEPAVVLQPGLAPAYVPAITVPGVRDTTGAGDAFAAGFLIASADGADPVAAAAHGHEVAAAAVRRASAVSS